MGWESRGWLGTYSHCPAQFTSLITPNISIERPDAHLADGPTQDVAMATHRPYLHDFTGVCHVNLTFLLNHTYGRPSGRGGRGQLTTPRGGLCVYGGKCLRNSKRRKLQEQRFFCGGFCSPPEICREASHHLRWFMWRSSAGRGGLLGREVWPLGVSAHVSAGNDATGVRPKRKHTPSSPLCS